MKQKIILILCLLTIGISLVYALYLYSPKSNEHTNNFTRIFPTHPVLKTEIQNLDYNSYYVAGVTSNYIYLGNMTIPLRLLIVNTLVVTDTQHLNINVTKHISPKSFYINIDSPYYYLIDMETHNILQAPLNTFETRFYTHVNVSRSMLSDVLPISASTLILRSVSNKGDQYFFGKVTTQASIDSGVNLLGKEKDAVFSADGMLRYSKTTGRLVYTYYYRNQFVCMDTNLNLLYKGKTIDTISHAQIKVSTITSENKITLASPPLIVNKASCVSDKFLFVNSSLIADNEKKGVFNKASVIDVYDLKSGKYRFSFYLNNHNGNKIKSMGVYKNIVVAIHDKYLIKYNISPQLLK